MVVQVGDKVLVYGAGTPWAFAKKIEPVEVGDKVDVVTLSDGTKLAMPKIELDLSEYVWVVPEFDTPFNIGDVPFQWGMMPLGAAVFTVTGITDCWCVEDNKREWGGDSSITGCMMIILTGTNKGLQYIISSYNLGIYTLTLNPTFPPPGFFGWTHWSTFGGPPATVTVNAGESLCVYCRSSKMSFATASISSPLFSIIGAKTVTIPLKMVNSDPPFTQVTMGGGFSYNLNNALVRANTILSPDELIEHNLPGGYYINPHYPGYTNITVNYSINYSGSIGVFVDCSFLGDGTIVDIQMGPLSFRESDCITDGLVPGDKYVIYNPVTKRLVFNDATKLLTAANWQTGGEGAEISSSSVEYVWDGQGYVYLTSSKTTFSTIQFDDLLQVQAVHGETVRTIPMHLGERIAQGEETVSRELTNITSILRSGKNTITLTAKNQDGTKVGFVTAVYVKRSMS